MQSNINLTQESQAVFELYEVLAQSKDIEEEIFTSTFEILSKQGKTQDCLIFLSSNEIFKYFDQKGILNSVEDEIKKLNEFLKVVKEHDFNKSNFSTENHNETRSLLIEKISNHPRIIECLKFLVHLTAVDEAFIQSGSNSLNLLVQMKIDLNKQCWQNIRIRNTSLYRANFVKCNLSGSEFENVDMVGVNLNRALLFHCKWTNVNVGELPDLQEKSNFICFSPDCITLATCGDYLNQGPIKFWNIKTAKTYKQVKRQVSSLCYSPDGSTLAVHLTSVTLLIDVRTGKIKHKFNENFQPYSFSSFSPDSSTLAIVSSNNSINLWDLKIGKHKSKLCFHNKIVFSVCFSIDGKILVSGGLDSFICLWDMKTEKLKQKLPVQLDTCQSISFASDGTWFASAGYGGSIHIWNMQTGELKQQFYCRNNDKDRNFFGKLSPDGSTLASFSRDRLRFWDIQTGEHLREFNNGGRSLSFSSDSSILAAATWNAIKLFDVKQCIKEAKLKQNGHNDKIEKVCFSPDDAVLASSSSGSSSIYLWNVKTGELKSTLNKDKLSKVQSITFSPDGTTLASSYDDSQFNAADSCIRFWDVRTGQLQSEIIVGQYKANLICYSTDNNTLACSWYCQNHYQICILDLKSGKTKSEITGQIVTKHPLSFSPDCTIFASENQDHSIEIWEMNTGKLKLQLKGHKVKVDSVCFSSNGTTLVSISVKSIFLWNLNTGELKFELEQNVYSLCISADGATLAVGTYGIISIWNAQTGKLQCKLKGHSGQISSLSFSLDGKILASGGQDKAIRFWDLNDGTANQNNYNDFLSSNEQFKYLQEDLLKAEPNVTIGLISQSPLFQADGTLVFQGELKNQFGLNLKLLFEERGSILLEKQTK